MTPPKPVVLCILDGWGLSTETQGNAVAQAQTPTFDRIMADCPSATLITHGPDVGLPSGQMGNSEVGHTNIGAGRVVAMDLGQIDLAIEDGSFFDNEALNSFIEKIKSTGGRAHIAGLASPGGVHSHQSHIIAAAQALTGAGLEVLVHAITDGRDVAPSSATGQIADLDEKLPEGARIVTVSGRYFAMDRDNRWERVEKAVTAITRGDVPHHENAIAGIEAAYDAGQTDEFIEPFRVGDYDGMTKADGLFFINFRADRAREILSAIGDPDFNAHDMGPRVQLSALLGMVEYSAAHNAFMTTVFPKRDIENTLGAWVAKQGLTQFRLAETEKYPHVTFFLNGGVETPDAGEDRYMPSSPKVATYDMQPEMSAAEVTEAFVKAINDRYDLIVVNYANPDMVGHTGDLAAAIKACEAVDQGLSEVVSALESASGAMVLCADHGNCEMMIDPETGGPHTAHTLNPVPVAVIGAQGTLADGRLADLAPTVLALMGLDVPPEMTGRNLLS
jgi:2,3-bisphosphoglycerate-independent phosphoglycerate mutase